MSNPKAQKPKLDFVAKYVRSVCSGATPSPYPMNQSGTKRVYRNLSWLTFGHPGVDEFNRIVARLQEECAPKGDVSVTTLEYALHRVLSSAQGQDHALDKRVDSALNHVRAVLNAPSAKYECWLEVVGFDPQSLPLTFGQTSFAQLKPTRRNPERLSIHKLNSSLPRKTLKSIQDNFGEDFIRSSVAISSVEARDATAAPDVAEREIREAIECLNFFVDLIAPGQGKIALPGEGTSAGMSTRFMVSEDGRYNSRAWRRHSSGSFSISQLHEHGTSIANAVQTAEQILCTSDIDRNEVEKLLLSAVRWGGRAAAASAPQDAFLFSTIALECLAIPSGRGELTYRLSHRLARLLEPEHGKRNQTAKKVRDFYGIRSDVVHDGSFRASLEDQYEMREMLTKTIIEMLTNERITQIQKRDKLNDYFEEILLS